MLLGFFIGFLLSLLLLTSVTPPSFFLFETKMTCVTWFTPQNATDNVH